MPEPRYRFDLSRLTLAAAVLLGLAVIWAAPKPAMIDVPQHAGQLALLRDLLFGHSPWAGEVRINFNTPYLLGYAVTLPLLAIMPVAAAMKTVLSIAFLAFVGVGMMVRRELGATHRLDVFLALPFFGFAYGWGLYTYLTAAPVALFFLWLAVRHAREPTFGRGLAVAAVSVALLWCHGLAFLMAVGCGGLVLMGASRSVKEFLLAVWPYVVAALVLGLYLFTQREFGAQNLNTADVALNWGSPLERLAINISSFDTHYASFKRGVIFLVLLAIPFAMGLRIDWKRREANMIAGAVLLACLIVPANMWATNLVYQRLGLFLLPALGWMFVEPRRADSPRLAPAQIASAGLLALVSLAVMALHLSDGIRFGYEQADFEAILARLQPGQRAAALIFDRDSKVGYMPDTYLHYGLWYQAEKQGFVEFNFAWFAPEVVRYRQITAATISPEVSLRPSTFDWKANQGDRFRYFLVRDVKAPDVPAFHQSPCPPKLIAHAGEWYAFEAATCG